jgi:hypothetical protein
MRRLSILIAFSLLALPAMVPAQVMPATVVRRGGASGLAMSDGEPISFIWSTRRSSIWWTVSVRT